MEENATPLVCPIQGCHSTRTTLGHRHANHACRSCHGQIHKLLRLDHMARRNIDHPSLLLTWYCTIHPAP
jgi:hypothetical protein